MDKRIIVFSPHPDDETFGCGGTIAKKISEGYEVMIVVMTDGRHSLSARLGIMSNPTPEEVKEIRKDEIRSATKILGVPEENLLFLDFIDGALEKAEKEAYKKVVEILKESHSAVEVYYPYEKDCHLDHQVTNRIVKNAIRELGIKTKEYRYSIVRIHARVGPLIDVFFNLFKRNMVRFDVCKFLSLKKAAISEYKSEISIISCKQVTPLNGNFKQYLKKEETFFVDH
jgi:LmbE family N-acetylglucosaminyl deacetylase